MYSLLGRSFWQLGNVVGDMALFSLTFFLSIDMMDEVMVGLGWIWADVQHSMRGVIVLG